MKLRDKRVEKAQTSVIFKVPFFGPGVARLPVIWDDSIPTACTSGKNIRWNPKFFDSMTDAQLVTVLVHETAHCLLGHVWRAPSGCDWKQWNIACDHAVNLMLKDFSAGVMAKGLSDPFPFPEPADSYCADPVYFGLAEEVIYSRLTHRQKPQQPGGGGQGKGQGGSGGMQTPSGPSKGQGGAGKPGVGQPAVKPATSSMPSFGQIARPEGSQSIQKKLQGDWTNTLIQSARIAQGQGSLPASMHRLVGQMVNPQVPWYQLLRSWLREQCSDDWNWLEPAMEYSESGFILPSLKSDRIGTVVFATDTSGSIDNTVLAQFQIEKQDVLDTLRPRSLTDIYCDAKIHKVVEYSTGEIISREAPGGGGTNLRKIFDWIEKSNTVPKCLVILTDLETPFPKCAPSYPVIWVVSGNAEEAPFGMTVRIEQT